MKNILNAIMNLSISENNRIIESVGSNNRANAMGDSLEDYIKNLFADTFNCSDKNELNIKYEKTFSYLGNSNNPPDIILRSGDAIEVKKVQGRTSALALNSSYPKHKISADSEMITKECRECEEWDVKDIIYAVGNIPKGETKLKYLCFVYGEDYAAHSDVYKRVKNGIKEGVLTIPDIKFDETTKELGKVKKVDPLGITDLRIRGMWHIENPMKTYRYIFEPSDNKFSFMAIINFSKYFSFENREEFEEFVVGNDNIELSDEKINNPNNPARLKDVKLITITF